ncbi:MAG: hypothetical protein AAF108_00475 [Planctomycetota bacterium]
MSVPDRVTEFLGPRAASGRPEDVLRLATTAGGPFDAARIEKVKLARLAEVDRHPQAGTPAADDARLAVHVAAAVLIERLSASVSAAAGPPSPRSTSDAMTTPRPAVVPGGVAAGPIAPAPSGVPTSWVRFAAAARPVLARCGGVDRRSITLLALLAQRHGLSIREIPLALHAIRADPITATPPVPEYTAAAHVPDDESADRSGRGRVLAGVVAFVVLTAVLFVFALREVYPASLEGAGDGPRAVAVAEPSAPSDEVPEPESPRPTGADALAEAAATAASAPSEAIELAAEGFAGLAAGWHVLPGDERARATERFVTVAESAWARSARVERLRQSILSLADDPVSAVAAADLTQALIAVDDLPVSAGEAIAAVAADLPGGSANREDVLDAMAISLARSGAGVERIGRWLDASMFVHGASASFTRARLRAARAQLVEAPVGGTVSTPDRRLVLAKLVEGLAIAEESPAGRWLVALFRDPEIGTDDLHLVTRLVHLSVENAATAGDLVLPVDADPAERTRIRENYDRVVTPGRLGPSRQIVQSWASAARATLRQSVAPLTTSDRLERLVLFSRLNEAAAALEDETLSAPIIADLSKPVTDIRAALSNAPAEDPFRSVQGEQWAIGFYAAARSPALRRKALEEINGFPAGLAPVAAELIVEEALRSVDRETRLLAEGIVRTRADEPTVLNAVLEALPTVARIAPNARLIEDVASVALPPVTDTDWPATARAALVSRLLESLGQLGPARRTRALTAALEISYAARAELDPGAGLQASASALVRSFESRAAALVAPYEAVPPLEELTRRARGRAAVARGLMQRFAAAQATAFELDAYAAASEDASTGPAIRGLLDELAAERRTARDVLDQIIAVERAWTRLWFIRLGERSSA